MYFAISDTFQTFIEIRSSIYTFVMYDRVEKNYFMGTFSACKTVRSYFGEGLEGSITSCKTIYKYNPSPFQAEILRLRFISY